MFGVLTDQTLATEDKTTGKALAKISSTLGLTDPTGDNITGVHATLHMEGDANTYFNDNPVVNGNFETGDLTGWTPDTTFGYATASIDTSADGRYAARIGRWDQPYTFFGGLNGPSVPGAEPFGTDYLYQDVTLPSGLSSITLQFDYDVVTYDGARYDWFDALVVDPNTGGTLLTAVSHEGGIIAGSPSNWGLYYTTGWKHATLDLTAYAGHKVRLYYGVRQDGYGDQCAAYVDKVTIKCQQ